MMIAPMEADQLDGVASLEAQDGDVRWTRANFEKELKGEFKRFFVALSSDVPQPTLDLGPRTDIVGYVGYWKAGSEAQITNLVVRAESRCQGVGKRLLEFILDCARAEMCETCTLEVRRSNAHAQSLYRSLGFEVKGTRPKMYQNPEEDAVLMEKKL